MLGKLRANVFRCVTALAVAVIVWMGAASSIGIDAAASQAVPPQPAAAPARPLVDQYCASCHNDRLKSGELVLAGVDLSDVARNAFDLEGKVIGTIGAGRIGYRVLQRLLPFGPKELIYYDYATLPAEAEKAVGARRVKDLKEFISQCDGVTVNAPLHEGTLNLINKDLLSHFKPGAWLVEHRAWHDLQCGGRRGRRQERPAPRLRR